MTGLSSGTLYEFKVAAITENGTSPLSASSGPIATMKNRRNQPIFKHLRARADEKSGGIQAKPNLPLVDSTQITEDVAGGGTGLTPRYEDHKVISDVAHSFDHRHGRPSLRSGQEHRDEIEKSPNKPPTQFDIDAGEGGHLRQQAPDININSNDRVAPDKGQPASNEKQRTLAAKCGENLPCVLCLFF